MGNFFFFWLKHIFHEWKLTHSIWETLNTHKTWHIDWLKKCQSIWKWIFSPHIYHCWTLIGCSESKVVFPCCLCHFHWLCCYYNYYYQFHYHLGVNQSGYLWMQIKSIHWKKKILKWKYNARAVETKKKKKTKEHVPLSQALNEVLLFVVSCIFDLFLFRMNKASFTIEKFLNSLWFKAVSTLWFQINLSNTREWKTISEEENMTRNLEIGVFF